MEEITVIVDEKMDGLRIDKALKGKVDLSRTRLQKLIEEGLICVDEEPVKSNYKVRIDEEITIDLPEEVEKAVKPHKMDLDIVYEDDEIIIINKPKGIIVHPTASTKELTLVEGVLYHCGKLSDINGVLRPGVVHRIDKETTGLIIMAKNNTAHQFLAEQLASHKMSRKYYALVHGVIGHDHGTIDAPIGRDPYDRKKMAVTDKNSKDAVTYFTVVERFKNHSLVECSLKTGRTHQIRVHMEYIGYPIVNDSTYTSRKQKGDGQMLHAGELSFIHPETKKCMTVKADLPEDFKEYLQQLRKEVLYNE
ncbi:MAG: RluA family pseudouridine synthase [Erysipelotrichaceae bacterium]|jgi:23S rRNA pseudouridine1911/1915/1917 synthase